MRSRRVHQMASELTTDQASADRTCLQCSMPIGQGKTLYEHRTFGTYCETCVETAEPAWLSARRGGSSDGNAPAVIRAYEARPVTRLDVRIASVGSILARRIVTFPGLIYRVTPSEFEDLVCDRLSAMGLEPHKVGHTHRKDGGVDILFWPRRYQAFPFLGAVQVKHHSEPGRLVPPFVVRDFAGVVAGHQFNAGLLVTNTGFSPDAHWFAKHHGRLLRLRDLQDLQRWLRNDFAAEEEWREIPDSIELCPGVIIPIPKPEKSKIGDPYSGFDYWISY